MEQLYNLFNKYEDPPMLDGWTVILFPCPSLPLPEKFFFFIVPGKLFSRIMHERVRMGTISKIWKCSGIYLGQRWCGPFFFFLLFRILQNAWIWLDDLGKCCDRVKQIWIHSELNYGIFCMNSLLIAGCWIQ